jgi:hypothetical protein
MVDRFIGPRVPQEYFGPSPKLRANPADVARLHRGEGLVPVDVILEAVVLDQTLQERIQSFVNSVASTQTIIDATYLLLEIASVYGNPSEQKYVRKAYGELARQIHPDLHAGDDNADEIRRKTKLMSGVNAAYNSVSSKKSESDAFAA